MAALGMPHLGLYTGRQGRRSPGCTPAREVDAQRYKCRSTMKSNSHGLGTLQKLSLLFCCCSPVSAQALHGTRTLLEQLDALANDSGTQTDLLLQRANHSHHLHQMYRNLHALCRENCDHSRLQAWMASHYSSQPPSSHGQSLSSMGQFAPSQLSLTKSPKAAWYLGRRKRTPPAPTDHSAEVDDVDQLDELSPVDRRSISDWHVHPCLRPHREPSSRLCRIPQPRTAPEGLPLQPAVANGRILRTVQIVRREQLPQSVPRVRSRSASGAVSWYLGKRSGAPAAVSWYLGKRSPVIPPRLVSRSSPDQSGRIGPLRTAWPLEKRSTPSTTWYLGRRRRRSE